MAAFTIQTGPVPLFATAPAVAGGPIQFLAQNNAANQQWVLAPAAAGVTLIQPVVGNPAFADIVGGAVADQPVSVGAGANNWVITPAANGSTIQLRAAPFFWGLNGNNDATLVAFAAAGTFNIVPI